MTDKLKLIYIIFITGVVRVLRLGEGDVHMPNVMGRRSIVCLTSALCWAWSGFVSAQISVRPDSIVLDRPEASQQVLVTDQVGSQRTDLSRQVTYEVLDPKVIRINVDGLVHPLSEGTTQFVVRRGDQQVAIPVTVTGIAPPEPVSFKLDVQPILTKSRCNSGGCHGKAEGQNGFKLSLFGFDNESDYDALVKEQRGRRVNLTRPDTSLLLMKGTASVPHGGGLKLDREGPQFEMLRRWVREGTPFQSPNEQMVVRIEVDPVELVMQPGATQQLRVTAIDAIGRRQCVTTSAEYVSNATQIVTTNARGLMTATDVPGEAAILVRYLDQVAVCRITLPRPNASSSRLNEHNFIDKHVSDKLIRLSIPPSGPINDSTFLRRVSLDLIGTLPTADEARRFLSDAAPDKRTRLIDELLQRPEYADYWAMKWADLLRADKIKVTPQGAVGITRWLRSKLAANQPFDQFAREILTVQGPIQAESPAAFFKALDTPEVAARSVSQLFLGVRIECAQCHHHPSERWSQDDYAGLVGFFTGLTVKRLPNGTEAIVAKAGSDHKHPRTGELVKARGLGASPTDFQGTTDRRQVFAQWMTHHDNPFFAKAIVNRTWAHYFGRGLVEPIDDLRATNPSTNEPLMEALVAHLKDVHYDIKAFTRTLLTSQAYQLSTLTNDGNVGDFQNFSHALPKSMPAEVLLDAVSRVTNVPEKFNGWPEGYRSIQVWDNRMPSYFFRIFGRPVRASVCECERSNQPSISQALHLLNSPEIQGKISSKRGTARHLADSPLTNDEILDEIYLTTLSRFPTDEERTLLRQAFLEDQDRRAAVEDIFWSVLNTKEFLYNQ